MQTEKENKKRISLCSVSAACGEKKKSRDQKIRTGIRKRGRIRSGLWPLFEWRENKENLGWDMKESRKEWKTSSSQDDHREEVGTASGGIGLEKSWTKA